MRKIIIGIELLWWNKRCVLENDNNLLSNIVSSQVQIHQKYGGVMWSIQNPCRTTMVLEGLNKANVTMEDVKRLL